MHFLASLHVRSFEQWVQVVKFANKNCICISFTGDEQMQYENALALAYVKKEITLRQFDSYIPVSESNTPLDILRSAACNLECEEPSATNNANIALIRKALASKEMAKYYKGRN